MKQSRLKEILEGFQGKRVLVIGDLMLDRYLWGHVDRISPEAPVPVVAVDSETAMPGGAANVIHNLHELGAEVSAAGVVGDDVNGERLRKLLEAERVDLTGIVVDSQRTTTSKTRVMAQGQQLVRTDREDRAPVADEAGRKLGDLICNAADIDAIFVSDYAKGVVSNEIMDVVRQAKARLGCPTIVDPKGRDFSKYRSVTSISPNEPEALAATNRGRDGNEEVIQSGHDLVDQLDLDAVYLTRGSQGATVFERGGAASDISATNHEVYDGAGAGDSAAAAYTLALLSNTSHREAGYVGNLAGGVVVGKVGVATASVEEIMEADEEMRMRNEEMRDRSVPPSRLEPPWRTG